MGEGGILDTIKLQAFCTVAELQNISKAAEQLYYTQPAISTQIRALENEYGVVLFYRNGNKIELTEAGEQLLPMARKLLDYFKESRETVRTVSEEKKRFIRIGASAMPGVYTLPQLLAGFLEEYPQYTVSISIASAYQLERMMMEHEVDVGLIGRTGPTPNAKHFIEEELYKDPLVLVANPKHPFAKHSSVPCSQLAEEQLILPPNRILTRVTVEKRLNELGIDFNLFLEVSSSEAIKRLVMNNLGVSVMCASMVKAEVNAGLLHALNVDDLSLWREIYVSIPSNRGAAMATKDFVDWALHEFRNIPR